MKRASKSPNIQTVILNNISELTATDTAKTVGFESGISHKQVSTTEDAETLKHAGAPDNPSYPPTSKKRSPNTLPTSDNFHLSEPKCVSHFDDLAPKISAFTLQLTANPRDQHLRSGNSPPKNDGADKIESYLRASLSANTFKAYNCDCKHYLAWGGNFPATAFEIARYITDHATTLSVATLERRLVAIGTAHRHLGFVSPTEDVLVKLTIKGIKNVHGTAQKQAKALVREELFDVLDIFRDRPKDIRDKALLLVGFAGGFRRSELVALEVEDFQHVRQGIVINIKRSKTDQTAKGRRVAIPFGRTRHCPVLAVERWLDYARFEVGPMFRPINRSGTVGDGRLSDRAVSNIVKERVSAAGFNSEGYSGHSLRSGFATSAAQIGISSWKIRAQTGHASEAMLNKYIRDGELFIGNAAGLLL